MKIHHDRVHALVDVTVQRHCVAKRSVLKKSVAIF